MKRIIIAATAAAALALGLGITAANAAPQPVERTLPSGAQTANVAPMALPSGACGPLIQGTLFVPPGTRVTAAQAAAAFGAQVRDTTRPSLLAPPTDRRVVQSGGSWTSNRHMSTALLETTADLQQRRWYQIVWQAC